VDHARLRAQFAGLERRTGRSGRDSIDHGPSGHDDVCNAAAGALVLAHGAAARRPVALQFFSGAGDAVISDDDPLYLECLAAARKAYGLPEEE
jgi:hypothetical protein